MAYTHILGKGKLYDVRANTCYSLWGVRLQHLCRFVLSNRNTGLQIGKRGLAMLQWIILVERGTRSGNSRDGNTIVCIRARLAGICIGQAMVPGPSNDEEPEEDWFMECEPPDDIFMDVDPEEPPDEVMAQGVEPEASQRDPCAGAGRNHVVEHTEGAFEYHPEGPRRTDDQQTPFAQRLTVQQQARLQSLVTTTQDPPTVVPPAPTAEAGRNPSPSPVLQQILSSA